MITNKTLYLFVDESGNLDFSPKGTSYFVLSSVATFHPCSYKESLLKLKYDLLRDNQNLEFFHATEDRQVTRDQVFEIIKKSKNCLELDSVIVQKNKTNPILYNEHYVKRGKKITRQVGAKIYQVACRTLLRYIFKRHSAKSVDKIVVVLGSIFTKEKQSMILKGLKPYLKNTFQQPFVIYFHSSKSDLNCQIADYCCWAIAIKWERGEERPYFLLKENNLIKSEFDIFQTGTQHFY